MSTLIFTDVFKHSIDGLRIGAFENEDRINRLGHKEQYKVFYKMGSSGFITFTLLQIILGSSHQLSLFRKGIVDDHTSGPIKGLLLRAGIRLEQELTKVSLRKKHSLHGFVSLITSAYKAYKNANPSNIVEFARCIQITKYAMDYYGYFAVYSVKYALIADTFNPKRQALGLICNLFGVPVYSFSVTRAGMRKASPFNVKTYFCWTKDNRDFLLKNTKSDVILMSSSLGKAMKIPIKENAKYGLVLNAKYITENIKDFVKMLKVDYSIENVQIRPHPGHDRPLLLEGVEVRDWQEPLTSYLSSVDCVFAPNTNAMAEALQQGVPVVYVQNLGEGPYDMYEFVKKRIVLPFDSNMAFPGSVNVFYSLETTKSALEIFNERFQQNDRSEKQSILSILN